MKIKLFLVLIWGCLFQQASADVVATEAPFLTGTVAESENLIPGTAIWKEEAVKESADLIPEPFIWNEEEIAEYDDRLSSFIKEILENFRDQMGEGMEDLGVPPLDPLVIPNFDKSMDDSMAQLELRMRRINVTGIADFQIDSLKADLERGFFNISITLPSLTAMGYCYLDGMMIGIFPMSNDGPFYIRAHEVRIEGHGDLNLTTGGSTRVHMNDLRLALTFRRLDMKLDSLLGGSSWAKVLVRLLSTLAPRLFQHFHEDVMVVVNKALLKIINSELDKGTLSDLLDKIPFY